MNPYLLQKSGVIMINNNFIEYLDFINAYLFEELSTLVLEVQDTGRILRHNNALFKYIPENIDVNITSFDDVFDSKVIKKVILNNITCDKVELFPIKKTCVKLEGYCLDKAGKSLYIVENERLITEKLFRQMDEINLELSNLTREINKKNLKLNQKNEIITKMMFQDSLTKLNNRRYLYEEFKDLKNSFLKGEIKEMILVSIDIDHFKCINDSFGHDVGDKVLINFADLIKKYTRDVDLKIRLGGDEFLIVFINTGKELVRERLETLMRDFKKIRIDNIIHNYSISLGIASYMADESLESFIKRSDDALYQAKNQGRGRFIFAV